MKGSAALLALLLVFASPGVGQDFDNTDGTSSWRGLRLTPEYGFGQVLTTDATSVLRGFSLWAAVDFPGPVSFRAYVAIIGLRGDTHGTKSYTNIWESGLLSTPLPSVGLGSSGKSLADFRRLDFDVGITLHPFYAYAAYLRPVGSDPLMHLARPKAGNGSIDRTDTWKTEWRSYSTYEVEDDWETAFVADFEAPTVVPEPSTVILLGSGLLGLGVVAWRRREREAKEETSEA